MIDTNPKLLWTGRIISTLVVLPLLLSGAMKLSRKPMVIDGFNHLGIPLSLLTTLAILELGAILLYSIPATSVLGAILITGYMGGAICTHLRVHEPVIIQSAIPVLAWLGLWLRESRLRGVLPFRK